MTDHEKIRRETHLWVVWSSNYYDPELGHEYHSPSDIQVGEDGDLGGEGGE